MGEIQLLNTKLKELRKFKDELQKVEETNEQYTSLLTKREFIEKQIEESRSEVSLLTKQQTRLEEWKNSPHCFNKKKSFKKNWCHMIT